MILSLRTDRSGQTVQTQIRLLLEEQSDQGLHCLQFQLHLLGALLFGKVILFKFYSDYSKFLGVRIFRIFTVLLFAFCLHLWIHFSVVKPHCSNFRIIIAIFFRCLNFSKFVW